MVNELVSDKLQIREVVENWVVWRDSADWERFATVWHSDGWMTATWFQGPASEFIEVSRRGFEAGVNILHQLGGFSCEVAGGRAVAQTKMTIHQRASLEGIPTDVVCWGRFYDFFEKRDERWAIVRRQPIYEKDRLDPVDPSARLETRRRSAGRLPRGLPLPGLPADQGRLHREAGSAGAAGRTGAEAVRRGRRVAERGAPTRRGAVMRRLIASHVEGSIEDSTNRTEEE